MNSGEGNKNDKLSSILYANSACYISSLFGLKSVNQGFHGFYQNRSMVNLAHLVFWQNKNQIKYKIAS